jgi:threonine/homoserine/homoserine lactone efflux protein
VDNNLLVFFAVSAFSTATPGPAVLYVATRGAQGGVAHGLAASAGVLGADALFILLSATGVTALLSASYELFGLVRLVGAGYLIYLGVRLLRSASCVGAAAPPPHVLSGTLGKTFLGGVVMHGANPKALLFFGSLVPQFVSLERPIGAQLISIAAIHLVTAAAVLVAYSVLSAHVGRLRIDDRVRRLFGGAAGLVFVGSGATLALMRSDVG